MHGLLVFATENFLVYSFWRSPQGSLHSVSLSSSKRIDIVRSVRRLRRLSPPPSRQCFVLSAQTLTRQQKYCIIIQVTVS
jgi:hypothetical protein